MIVEILQTYIYNRLRYFLIRMNYLFASVKLFIPCLSSRALLCGISQPLHAHSHAPYHLMCKVENECEHNSMHCCNSVLAAIRGETQEDCGSQDEEQDSRIECNEDIHYTINKQKKLYRLSLNIIRISFHSTFFHEDKNVLKKRKNVVMLSVFCSNFRFAQSLTISWNELHRK